MDIFQPIRPKVKPDPTKMQGFRSAQYYLHPEGEDYTGKLFATNKYLLGAAIPISFLDILLYTKPKGVFPTIRRFAYWTAPAVATATAFTTVTYAATRMRGKDDGWNYCLGSCAAAACVGAWQRSMVLGISLCVAFSIAGRTKRLSFEEGWEFFPQGVTETRVRGFNLPSRYDFTLTKDGEKGYVTQHDLKKE